MKRNLLSFDLLNAKEREAYVELTASLRYFGYKFETHNENIYADGAPRVIAHVVIESH